MQKREVTFQMTSRRVCLNSLIGGPFINDISGYLPIFSLILNKSSTSYKDKSVLLYFYFLFFGNKKKSAEVHLTMSWVKQNWAEMSGRNDLYCAYGIFVTSCTTITEKRAKKLTLLNNRILYLNENTFFI